MPAPSIEAASRRSPSSGYRPANAPKPVVPVDSTAARSRSTTDSASASETPASSYVFPSTATSLFRVAEAYTRRVLLAHSAQTTWSFEPLQLVPIAVGAALYWKRARTLARKGTPVAEWRYFLFSLGIGLLVVALVSPIATLGEEESFAFHMVQHLLLGDLAPLCIVAGLTGPLLRPILSLRAVRTLRFLTHPFVSLPLWAVNLYLWHLPFFWEGALRHQTVHALEHVSFFTAGALMWATVIEVLPGPEWFGTGAKMGYIVAVRIATTIIGNVFVWAGSPFYSIYEHAQRPWGLSAAADQGIAGGVMMIEGSIVTIGALAWLFLRLAQEGELRQELLERGVDPRSVRRAVRYGRANELSEST